MRVVPTSLEFIFKKYNFRSHSKFNRLNSFQDFRIATFPLYFIMYSVKGLSFNQTHQPLYVPWCCWCLLLNCFVVILTKMYPSPQAKSLIKHGIFFLILPYFNASFRKFQQNCRVFTNALGGSTLRFKIEARATT